MENAPKIDKIKTSEFGSKYSDVFVYSSETETQRVVLLLKGIYGFHTPLDVTKTDLVGLRWDHAFVRYLLPHTHVICVNTSRLENFDQSDFYSRRESFEGKNYQEEVRDVEQALDYALKYLVISHSIQPELHLIGNSFGGTTFLGMKDAVAEAHTISMIGSGCGKSVNSIRPLSRTLPDEDTLLETIRNYKGYFFAYRGDKDDIVPKESHEKIVNASGAKVTSYTVFKGVDHEFEKENDVESVNPSVMLRKMILNAILSAPPHLK